MRSLNASLALAKRQFRCTIRLFPNSLYYISVISAAYFVSLYYFFLCELRIELNFMKSMTYKNVLLRSDFIRFIKVSPIVETK